MTDKPEIKVGQKWVTRGGDIVRVLEVAEAAHGYAFCVTVRGRSEPYTVNLNGRFDDDGSEEKGDLISLAPATVKRTVALYRSGFNGELSPEACVEEVSEASDHWHCISEPVEIEFTLLPGEDA